jgi:hypothetical protein
MKTKSKQERLNIVLNIRRRLANFTTSTFESINLWDTEFPAIKTLKEIFKEYVNQQGDHMTGFSGKIQFPEIKRVIVYKLPISEHAKEEILLKSML